MASRRRFPVPRALPGVHNQTVRMMVRTSLGGKTLRVRLSNALGSSSLALGAARERVRVARRPMRVSNGSITSRGNPFGNSGNGFAK